MKQSDNAHPAHDNIKLLWECHKQLGNDAKSTAFFGDLYEEFNTLQSRLQIAVEGLKEIAGMEVSDLDYQRSAGPIAVRKAIEVLAQLQPDEVK